MTAEAIDQSTREWTYEPDRARGEASVTAFSHGSEAILTADGFSWRTDLPTELGGSNHAASPTHMLLGALAGCAVVVIRDTLAPQLGIPVDAVEATASCATDARGVLGMDGVKPDLRKLHLDVRITSPMGAAAVDQLGDAWQERSPIILSFSKPVELTLLFTAA